MKVVLSEFYTEDSVIRDGMRDAGVKVDDRSFMTVLTCLQDFFELDCDEVRKVSRCAATYLLCKGRLERDGE